MINLLKSIVLAVYNLLPNSPFRQMDFDGSTAEFLAFLNWFIPFDICGIMINTWLACIVVYYGYTIVKKIIDTILKTILTE